MVSSNTDAFQPGDLVVPRRPEWMACGDVTAVVVEVEEPQILVTEVKKSRRTTLRSCKLLINGALQYHTTHDWKVINEAR